MGSSNSKVKMRDMEQKQDAMMKEHAAMVKRLAEQQEAHKKEQDEQLEKMAQLMLLLVAQQQQKSDRGEKQQIEIEGVVYNVTEQLGKGGFGEVYKGESADGRRAVAIKVIDNSPMVQQQVENEIRFLRLTRKINLNPHPVIEYYGCKTTPRQILIAIELAECDLYKFWFQGMVHRSGEEQFIFGLVIMMYTLRALTFLERLNIIHGDIKPHNLVIVDTGKSLTVKLIDFGTIEKMNTHRSAVTVGEDKPYTQFFAAPEFLRQDSRGLVARRLHKKSDAWAAGVMFYLLFLGKLPWEDEYDYHNFINDPRARDIVAPVTGGYKLIIELLLKKDPDDRASAKDTLLQMKAHPQLGVVVSALEDKFHPADDVCHVRIPDSVREDMENLASPQQRAHMASNTSNSTRRAGGKRRSCRYGRECYRKNAEHREEFAHPGDPDYSSGEAASKPACQYGSQCYRKNPEHLEKYSHH